MTEFTGVNEGVYEFLQRSSKEKYALKKENRDKPGFIMLQAYYFFMLVLLLLQQPLLRLLQDDQRVQHKP
jgi:hypothetical protein